MTALRPLAVELLRVAHLESNITRAEAARRLGVGSGTSSELVGELVRAGLIAERPAAGTGGRGRPTRELVAAPRGPVVLAAAIRHGSWDVEVVALGGRRLAERSGRHDGGPQMLSGPAAAVADLRRRFRSRLRGLGVSAAGPVREGRRFDATSRELRDVDLRMLWPDAPLFAAGNDATLAAVAEGVRGSANSSALTVHLHVDVGLGGALLERGQVVEGAHGLAGEFGHLPMGEADVACPCGARGCWGASVDGAHLARLLDARAPDDPIGFARGVLADAAAGERTARTAVDRVAATLGRGTAGLANALDPDLVVLGGLAPEIRGAGSRAFDDAYAAGLMGSRRQDPPRIEQAVLGYRGPITGAGEAAWNLVWRSLTEGDPSSNGALPSSAADRRGRSR